MDWARLLRHLAFSRWQLAKAVPRATLLAVENEIRLAEARHHGEIRFVVEGALHGSDLLAGRTARDRAIELFSTLRVWDTEANSGVLIYLLLADRQLEIVADRGIHRRTAPGRWEAISQDMTQALARGAFETAALDSIHAVADCLETDTHGARANELSDRPLIL